MDALTTQYLPVVGKAGISTVVIMLIIFFFIWLLSQKAQIWGIQQLKLPFGTHLTFGSTLEQVNQMMESDAMVVDGMTDAVKQLEAYACQRMRQVMTQCIHKYTRTYPQYKEAIIRAMLPITQIISDNHIISWLTTNNLDTYIHEKQSQVITSVESVNGDTHDKHVTLILKKLVRDFIFNIMPVQTYLCLEKIKLYNKSLKMLQMQSNKIRSQYRIEKNKKHLDNIDAVVSTISSVLEMRHDNHAANNNAKSIASEMDGANMLNSETLLNEYMLFIKNMINDPNRPNPNHALTSGIINMLNTAFDSSDIILPNGNIITDRRKEVRTAPPRNKATDTKTTSDSDVKKI